MNDRYYDGDSENLPEEGYLDRPPFGRPASKKSTRPAWFIIPLIGVAFVLLAMLIIWFWEKPLTEGPEKRLQLLEKRIENLESQVVRLNELNEKWIVLESRNQKLQTALERVERMETSINRRLDELRRDVNALGKTGSAASSESAGKPDTAPSKAAPQPASPSQPTADEAPKMHAVQAGETLYSISRKYGLSVEELKKNNNLQDNTIRVGQELRIR